MKEAKVCINKTVGLVAAVAVIALVAIVGANYLGNQNMGSDTRASTNVCSGVLMKTNVMDVGGYSCEFASKGVTDANGKSSTQRMLTGNECTPVNKTDGSFSYYAKSFSYQPNQVGKKVNGRDVVTDDVHCAVGKIVSYGAKVYKTLDGVDPGIDTGRYAPFVKDGNNYLCLINELGDYTGVEFNLTTGATKTKGSHCPNTPACIYNGKPLNPLVVALAATFMPDYAYSTDPSDPTNSTFCVVTINGFNTGYYCNHKSDGTGLIGNSASLALKAPSLSQCYVEPKAVITNKALKKACNDPSNNWSNYECITGWKFGVDKGVYTCGCLSGSLDKGYPVLHQ
jgi:hypothetical protein